MVHTCLTYAVACSLLISSSLPPQPGASMCAQLRAEPPLGSSVQQCPTSVQHTVVPGRVPVVCLPSDAHGGKSTRFQLRDRDTACQQLRSSPAVSLMQVNGMLVEGQKVFVAPFVKRTERGGDREANYTNVYVKNLPDDVDDEGLAKMFGEHGKVTSAVVKMVSLDRMGAPECAVVKAPSLLLVMR